MKYTNFSPAIKNILKFGVIFGLVFWVCFHRIDVDFGWHLQAGNYARQNGIPETDVFTYTANDFRWINHEWGNDYLVSYLFEWGGYTALAIFFSLLWTLGLWVVGHRAKFLTLLLATSALVPYLGIRPLAWSVLFFAILLRMGNSKKEWAVYLSPLLILVWANLHGSFAIGLFLIAYFAISKKSPQWLIAFLISVVASFVNHYGPEIYTEIFRTLLDSSKHDVISEWKRFKIAPGSMIFVSLWAAGFWFFEKKRLKSFLKLPFLMFLAALSSTRHLPLFVISSIEDFDNYIEKFRTETLRTDGNAKSEKIKRLILTGMLVIALASLIFFNQKTFLDDSAADSSYPNQSVSYLKRNPCKGNIFNHYDFGGYLIWKLPQNKIYIDGRMLSWKGNSGEYYFEKHQNILRNKNFQEQEFEKYNIRCVLVDNRIATKRLVESLRDNHWRHVTSESSSEILLIKD